MQKIITVKSNMEVLKRGYKLPIFQEYIKLDTTIIFKELLY